MRARCELGLVVCLLLAACGNPPPERGSAPATTADDPAGTTRHEAFDQRFSIALPTDWQVMDSYQGAAVTAFGPPTDSEAARPVLSVVIEKLIEPLSLSDYVAKSTARPAAGITDFQELEVGDATLSGQPARWLLATYRLENREIKALVHFAVIDQTAFVITTACDPASYDGLAERFKELVNSFRLQPPESAATEVR